MLKNGKTSDNTLAAIARNIQMQAAKDNIILKVVHVQVKQNTAADVLSRWGQEPNMVKLKTTIANPQWIAVPVNYTDIDWSI